MEKNKGITLIALVITIIVLLILAGVTINAIVGNESAMEKAKQAKLEDEKGNELDTIKLAVVDGISIGDNGQLTLDNLKTALRKIPAVVEETEVNKIQGRAPWTVKAISGREYDITQYGQVTESTPRPAGLYNDDGYTPWDKLIEDGVISFDTYGSLIVPNKNAINGDLIIIDDGSVTVIGNSAFMDCTGLTSIKIPEGVTNIYANTFWGCSSLTSVKIPNSVTIIRNHAFAECSSLSSIIIPDSITSIEPSAFYKCSSLSSIIIPDSITSIGDHTFDYCSKLTSINIPEGVTSIGIQAFGYCSGLASISIPEGVTSIGHNAFYYCSNLASITIPASVISIGRNAFCGCNSLTSITIPNSVTCIDELTFYGCRNLTSIMIPDSVRTIGEGAFSSCGGLKTVNYTGTQEQWNAITIKGNNYELKAAQKIYNYVPES